MATPLFPRYESFPCWILTFLHTLCCVFNFLDHPLYLFLPFYSPLPKWVFSFPSIFPLSRPWNCAFLSLFLHLVTHLPFLQPFCPSPLFFPCLIKNSLPFPSPLSSPSSPSSTLHSKASVKFCAKMTPHQWPYFAVPPLRVSITFFCHASIAPLHVLALLPFLPLLFWQTAHGWHGCNSKKVSAAQICVSQGGQGIDHWNTALK